MIVSYSQSSLDGVKKKARACSAQSEGSLLRDAGYRGASYLWPRAVGLPAGHKARLIRPAAPLRCERLSGRFDSPSLAQQEGPGDN